MKNKQPFYHRATILFTATEPLTLNELEVILTEKLKGKPIVRHTVQVEVLEEPEPGDPADLM